MNKLKISSDGIIINSHGIKGDPLFVFNRETIKYAVNDYGDGATKKDLREVIRYIKTLRKFVEVEGALGDVYEDTTLGKYFDWAESQLKGAIR